MKHLVPLLCLVAGCGLDPIAQGPTLSDSGSSDNIDDQLLIGDLRIVPAEVDYGAIALQATVGEELILTNTGEETLSITSVYLDGDTAFSLSTTAVPFDLESGTDMVLTVSFTPDAEQDYSGTVNILVSGEADFGVIPLIGSGSLTGSTGGDDTGEDSEGLGALAVSTSSIDFGVVDIGDIGQEVVTVTNTGDAAVMITDITSTAAGIIDGDIGSVPLQLSAGDSRDLTVTYTPAEEVLTTAFIVIENDLGMELEVTASGEGFQDCTLCIPVISISTGGSDNSTMDQFSSVFGSTDTQTLTIQNNGDVDLEVTDITITNDTTAPSSLICGTDGRYTLASSFSGVVLPAYGTTSVQVSYTFNGSGLCGEISLYPLSNENTLVIKSNDVSTPEYVITLGGNGLGL